MGKSQSKPDLFSFIEETDFFPLNLNTENNHTSVKRVWIVKRAISLKHENIEIGFISDDVQAEYLKQMNALSTLFSERTLLKFLNLKASQNKMDSLHMTMLINERELALKLYHLAISELKSSVSVSFKHWAMILELSNKTFVNIQLGRKGFRLKEIHSSDSEGENAFEAICQTWGDSLGFFSFCYLGRADFEYEKLKEILWEMKEKEVESLLEKGEVGYNILYNNCQNFVCDLEKVLFGKSKLWHKFEYYLKDFFDCFFEGAFSKIKASYFDIYIEKINEYVK